MHPRTDRPHFVHVILTTVLLLVSATLSTSCERDRNVGRDMPKVLRIAVTPGESEQVLRDRFTPLLDKITNILGTDYELIIPASYGQMLERFRDDEIDLAFFGGFTFVKAHYDFGAVPLVIRDIDMKFTSYLIARKDQLELYRNSDTSIAFFKDKALCFGSKLSTSGHLMPRYYPEKMNILVDDYFSDIIYTGSHDRTASHVVDEDCALGAINSNAFHKIAATPGGAKLAVAWESQPYPDYVWSMQKTYRPAVRRKVRDAFLSLSPADTAHSRLLGDSGGYLPVSVQDFDRLYDIAVTSGLIETSQDH